jgi:hypothetical protein
MKPVTVVLVGLGRAGTRFYEKFRLLGEDRVRILAVCEKSTDFPLADRIRTDNVPFYAHYRDALARLGNEIDIILDTTNVPDVKSDIRRLLQESGNHHTVLAPLVVAYLLWHMSDPQEELAQDHKDPGY